MPYPKRLIEVDLPIKRISAHARKEKSIRNGHISTLHIWWARRPLAACRAVLCASLWPDPADSLCPKQFIEVAINEMQKWSKIEHLELLSKESYDHFIKVNHDSSLLQNKTFLRQLLLDFIADFSDWNNATHIDFIKTSRALTLISQSSLMNEDGSVPLVVDPFAGGGSIPLEALRVGADTFASDINPIPILLNTVQLEYVPKFGKQLSKEVRRLGIEIYDKTILDLGKYYFHDKTPKAESYQPLPQEILKRNGINWNLKRIIKETPIAFVWARTINCEGPKCGAKIPLVKSLYLDKKGKRSIGLKMIADKKNRTVSFEVIDDIKPNESGGTVRKGSVTCPCCDFVTPIKSVRAQLKAKNGGANSSQMIAVVSTLKTIRSSNKNEQAFEEIGRFYRNVMDVDLKKNDEASNAISKLISTNKPDLELIPMELTPPGGGSGAGRAFSQRNYGMLHFSDLFTNRQLLSLITFTKHIKSITFENLSVKDKQFENAVKTCLTFCLGRQADHSNSGCTWNSSGPKLQHLFGRAAIAIAWDFAEANPFGDSVGDWKHNLECVLIGLENSSHFLKSGSVQICDATIHPLPNESTDIFFTDPPYYDAVPYSDLSDFFYVWMKRTLHDSYPTLFDRDLTNKDDECIVDEIKGKDNAYFINTMERAMTEGRRITKPNGLGIVVFAHKTTDGWEAQLQAMLNAGWVFTASWPIDTELGTRLRGMNSAALASSVHLVCRPRENEEGTLIKNLIGDWRDVQEELPRRIHEWMPRLAEEGVAGADAIFACLGPALEIFSRYTKVVHAGSEREISLSEYLEKVWAAVSQEALNMVFHGGDAQGLEEDARLTAMWLWTLTAGAGEAGSIDQDSSGNDDENETTSLNKIASGFSLEYDTARKIAQGLGADLEDLRTLIEVKGDKARLLPVVERASKLFGASALQQQPVKKKKKVQMSLSFGDADLADDSKYELSELKVYEVGKTVLDRLHQAMLLFSTGRTEALKRFLVEDGAGKDDTFWKLAQSLTSLYPKDTDERRWVEAVQTYKKSLGF
jgi:putative DNA methylase